MSVFDGVGLLTLAVLALMLAVLFPLAVHRNLRMGQQYREGLITQLSSKPLGAVLKRMDVPLEQYVNRVRAVELHKHMGHCDRCDATQQCQAVHTADNPALIELLDFCPNQQTLRTLR